MIECLTTALVFFKQVSVLHGCKVLHLEQNQLQVYFPSLTHWWRKQDELIILKHERAAALIFAALQKPGASCHSVSFLQKQ